MEELQDRYDWYHTEDLKHKFHLMAKPSVQQMITREEKEAFFLECQNKGVLNEFFSSLLDYNENSKWDSKFMVYLFVKNPDFVSFYIFQL